MISERDSKVRELFSFLSLPSKWAEYAIADAKRHTKEQLTYLGKKKKKRDFFSSTSLSDDSDSDIIHRSRATKSARLKNRALSRGIWRYYSTFRDNGFDPNFWRKSLPLELVEKVQVNPICKQVLKTMNYEMYAINATKR